MNDVTERIQCRWCSWRLPLKLDRSPYSAYSHLSQHVYEKHPREFRELDIAERAWLAEQGEHVPDNAICGGLIEAGVEWPPL